MRIKLLLFPNSEKRQDDKDTIPPGSPVCGWELSWGEQGGREQGRRGRRTGGRKKQGVYQKINPFTVSSGCKVRYEADMSNEMLQSSKGKAIKAYSKLMELVISGSIKRIKIFVLSFGDLHWRWISSKKIPPSHFLLFHVIMILYRFRVEKGKKQSAKSCPHREISVLRNFY